MRPAPSYEDFIKTNTNLAHVSFEQYSNTKKLYDAFCKFCEENNIEKASLLIQDDTPRNFKTINNTSIHGGLPGDDLTPKPERFVSLKRMVRTLRWN
jgi:hypothetical protein